jgi:3-methylcrotonyl-CoA carboxylase beta subunit
MVQSSYPVLETHIDTSSLTFTHNQKVNQALAEQIKEQSKHGLVPEKKRAHNEFPKLSVHERIEHLLDANTPFLEFSALAANGQYNHQFPGAGIVTGVGYIHGQETVIVANNPAVKGGTYIRETIKKHLRAQEIALENHIPCVYIVESGGIFLPEQAYVYADKDHFGRIFYNQAKLSAAGIPQIAVVMGSCTAGGAYIPAMSDETIIVRNRGTIFLAGPPLVEAATGEVVSAEELGGADVHTHISGVADHLAENEEHALQLCRNLLFNIGNFNKQPVDRRSFDPPLYPPDELYGIIDTQNQQATNAYELIARLVDGSRFQEFRANYGQTLVTGYAHIMGYPVGIVANNGILFSESALKGTHFIELCNQRNLPLVFLQNISGFMVGKEYEHRGIAKDGAKMVHAVATSNVPKFTIVTGGSHGAGNYAMAGRAYNPTLLFMWPNAKISVMGGEQAAHVLSSIKKNGVEDVEEIRNKILKQYEHESSAMYSTSRLWDDGIIDLADTRTVLGIGLAMSLNHKYPEPKNGIYRM